MVLVDAVTARDRLVPVVGERDTSEEFQKHISDEPCDNDEADKYADYPKLLLPENALVVEEYR